MRTQLLDKVSWTDNSCFRLMSNTLLLCYVHYLLGLEPRVQIQRQWQHNCIGRRGFPHEGREPIDMWVYEEAGIIILDGSLP